MAVRIRMKKMGRRHRSFFRICAVDARAPRDGRVIEELGTYDPMIPETDARATINGERVNYWLSVGAQPSDKVKVLIKKYGAEGTHLEQQKAARERLIEKRGVKAVIAPPVAPKPAPPTPEPEAPDAPAKEPAAAEETPAETEAATEAPAEEKAAAEPATEEAATEEPTPEAEAATEETPKAEAAAEPATEEPAAEASGDDASDEDATAEDAPKE